MGATATCSVRSMSARCILTRARRRRRSRGGLPSGCSASFDAMLTVSGLKRLHISVSFDLQDGECVALQGPSGVGKTLLLRSIADLDPNEGTVKLDGTLREAMPAPDWRKRVTYLAAEPGWWSDIVQEHFSGWDEAFPLVTRLGLPHSCGPWPIQR